ncbi:MAG TPA: response regulator transcription factor [Solirubrobacteraceae bacterium]|nr:response regulator transcription factor [Solirubrobacteraceae bacterium]
MSATLRLLQSSFDVDGPSQLKAPIRVVLADDHAMVRRTLRLVLESEQDVDVIAEAVDLSAVLRHVGRHVPHVLVLDLRLPNGSSIEMIRQLRVRFPETAVVVLTMEENPLFAQHAIDAGAIGFVVKDRADTELLAAVRLAARGEGYVSPRVASGLEALERAKAGDGLTDRETEIVRMIALGHTSAEIAGKLHLSRRTVETHRMRIHNKLGFKSRAELVQFALQRRLIGA